MRHIKTLSVLFFITILLMTACAKSEITLQVTGNVANEKGWTGDQVGKMDTIEAEYTNKNGDISTYSGVLINDLLGEAKVNEGASMVVFLGDDGYTAEVTLEELQACPDCIVSSQNQDSFRIVMPGFSGKLQVKGVVEIQVK